MNFFATVRIYRDPEDAISLRDVWMIGDGELNARSAIACKRIENEAKLAELHRQVAWASQALVEFSDLAEFTPLAKGCAKSGTLDRQSGDI
ncbi:MAG: hypothetical protein F4213_08235 [Boseongicola sp. SB0677_bin_26]|nr:hypothetical protein [Boseongicola sp. SB0665_bin_10]MYG26000.1 hypothetical protein [Boseongicola sp. SB0677_bin_26]